MPKHTLNTLSRLNTKLDLVTSGKVEPDNFCLKLKHRLFQLIF